MSKHEGSSPWQFTIWGSRGSVPISTPELQSYGGQTTCHAIELDGARIIVDAGSGLVEMAREHAKEDKETLLLFTHLHWDHVVGFPFYAPLFREGWDLHVRGVPRSEQSVYSAVCALNQPPIFPIKLCEAVRANVHPADLPASGETTFHGVHIAWQEVWHPGGCSAFAFTLGDTRIVFTGDVEIPKADRDALLRFCRDADVLICDAQYTEAEYQRHVGWGHSTNLQAAELAREANVGRLILTHHDPGHDDAAIDAMVEEARSAFPATDGATRRMVVAEGRLAD